jgi:hypothetical protein
MHPRLYPEVCPSAVVLFFLVFPDLLSGLSRPAVRRLSLSTLLKTRLLLHPTGCNDNARGQATLPVSLPPQVVAPLNVGL